MGVLQEGESMKITYLSHSSFLVSSGGHSLLFDPYFIGNPCAPVKPEDVSPTHIFVTHSHDDHLGDAVSIAERCKSTVYASVETASLFPEGINLEVGQPGGSVPAAFGTVKFTWAVHGNGTVGGLSNGYLITIDGFKLYHAGDTGLTMDMSLLEEEQIDLALLPIGDRFTMGPKDALRAIKLIKPKKAVPMHYNTWPLIQQDPLKFKSEVEATTGTDVIIMNVGDTIEL
jgi:L-ascorbate metabolism protein UlaG (beta-lactamase superfamily)